MKIENRSALVISKLISESLLPKIIFVADTMTVLRMRQQCCRIAPFLDRTGKKKLPQNP